MKKTLSRNGANKIKNFYLKDAMQFVTPFMKSERNKIINLERQKRSPFWIEVGTVNPKQRQIIMITLKRTLQLLLQSLTKKKQVSQLLLKILKRKSDQLKLNAGIL